MISLDRIRAAAEAKPLIPDLPSAPYIVLDRQTLLALVRVAEAAKAWTTMPQPEHWRKLGEAVRALEE